MLTLTAGILCANLLTVDALHRKTLLDLSQLIMFLRRVAHIPQGRVAYLVFFFRAKLNKGSVNIIKRRCGQVRLTCGFWFWFWRRSGWHRRRWCGAWGRADSRWTRRSHWRAVQSLQGSSQRGGMRVHTVREHATIWCWHRRASRWGGSGRAAWSAWVAIC